MLEGNAGSILLALATCLACGSRIEHNYRRGAYGAVTVESIDGSGPLRTRPADAGVTELTRNL